jgi:hypothetical protein
MSFGALQRILGLVYGPEHPVAVGEQLTSIARY